MRSEEECYIRQSAELLDLQKNILRIGFDSSTDFHAVFKPSFRKKISCTIHGEEAESLPCSAKKYHDAKNFLAIAETSRVIFFGAENRPLNARELP
jgi:predicted transcriptional regulator